METPSTHAEKPATREQMAAVNFEPLSKEDLEACIPPKNEEWNALSASHLVTLRIAWRFLHMTKTEMIEALKKTPNDAGHELFNGFVSAIDFFKGCAELLESAETRILVAGSSIEIDDESGDHAGGEA